MDSYSTTDGPPNGSTSQPLPVFSGENIYHDPGNNSAFTMAHTAHSSDAVWTSVANHFNMGDCYGGAPFPTFPQTSTPPLPPYLAPGTAFHSELAMEFVCGPSTEESPISSSQEENGMQPFIGPAFGVTAAAMGGLQHYHMAQHGSFDYTPVVEHVPIPEGVKMPQRKGGMQLWQFLYALLTDPENKFLDLIEWTTNQKEREFRLLQPEAIAVWWGHHKNKENMSYDKLSRSLRYYYDKGLLKKIPGERYVYRFCIDPETMYKHIGNSESRPKLKPMPQAAKLAMSKSKLLEGEQSIELARNSFVAQPPESLTTVCPQTNVTSYSDQSLYTQNSFTATTAASTVTASDARLLSVPAAGTVSMRRCVSLDSYYHSTDTWEPPERHYPDTSAPITNSVSLTDFQLVPDSSFYSHSPQLSPYGSPLTSSGSCSPALLTGYGSAPSEGTTFDFIHPETTVSGPSFCTNSFYFPSSTLQTDMSMWTFAQE